MWLLADLFHDLPEAGDLDKPKLVFFFDEAHLLFNDASKAFLDQITQTVRLIRSKGVGVFFVTQSPKDVAPDVLGQLGNRVQHALRAYTPDDAKALRAAVSTFPKSGYDLEELLTTLGIGEAVVTVLSETGAPDPRRVDAAARPAVPDGPRSGAMLWRPPSAPPRCRRSTGRNSTASRPTSGCRPSWRRRRLPPRRNRPQARPERPNLPSRRRSGVPSGRNPP